MVLEKGWGGTSAEECQAVGQAQRREFDGVGLHHLPGCWVPSLHQGEHVLSAVVFYLGAVTPGIPHQQKVKWSALGWRTCQV